MHLELIPPAPPDVHRPRERALSDGVFALGDAELVALLLGTGVRGKTAGEVAVQLLEDLDGLDGVARAGPHPLAARHGVGMVKALRMLAGIELGRRFVYRAGRRGDPIHSSAAVLARFAPRLSAREDEEMWTVALDARNTVRACRRVAFGGAHACGLHPRDILRTGLAEGAVGLVVVHNHPSGNPAPSMDDVVMTKRLLAATDVVGVTLVDHVIIARDGDYRSMLDLGFIPERVPAPANLRERPYGTRLGPVPEVRWPDLDLGLV